VLHRAIAEVNRRPNPSRRLRSYPRVVKRTQIGDKLIKRERHTEVRHMERPKIQIEHGDVV